MAHPWFACAASYDDFSRLSPSVDMTAIVVASDGSDDVYGGVASLRGRATGECCRLRRVSTKDTRSLFLLSFLPSISHNNSLSSSFTFFPSLSPLWFSFSRQLSLSHILCG
ncbi:unnamed protein product [Microthlaspi erraticum]|uniref:Uncharacterized protein n=1 Tax=Microthlaspi erraticum TaxID=1685480 RepID=A0A6D2IP88_9BRAS|nr:unnamed protein product [Microthlaspi erraticum]